MKAIILSAGFGTRLLPLTQFIPKALVPYKGIPMINYQIQKLINAGVNEIIVNAHHHSEKIEEYFSDNKFDVKIHVLPEKEILGTGGGILNASEYLKSENYFFAINVDVDSDFDITAMLPAALRKNPLAVIAVQKRKSGRMLEFDDNMILKRRESELSLKKNLFAFNGMHLISSRIFGFNSDKKFLDIIELYFEAMKKNNEIIAGYDVMNSNFKDLGKNENLLA